MPHFKLKNLYPLLGLLLFGFALFFLWQELMQFSLEDFGAYVSRLGPGPILLATAFTIANYLSLSLYDVLSVRYAELKIPYRRILLSSFVAYVFSNNFGFSGLSASAVRLRFYSLYGVETFRIIQVIGFSMVTFWVGLAGTAGLGFLFAPPDHLQFSALGGMPFQILGGLCLGLVAAYLAISGLRKKPLFPGGHEFRFPRLSLALVQVPVAISDWILGAAVFFVLLPPHPDIAFLPFLSIFVLAMTAGLVSNIPAGLGVFDWVMLTWLSPYFPTPVVISIILAWRSIYLIIPLVLSVLLYGIHELFHVRSLIKWAGHLVREISLDFMPAILSLLVFSSGAVLFFSGKPGDPVGQTLSLAGLFPAWHAGFAHYISSILGLVLMVCALRLRAPDRTMYRFVLLVLSLACGLALGMGLEVQEFLVFFLTLLVMAGNWKRFLVKSPPGEKNHLAWWVLLIVVSCVLTVWLGAFASPGFNYPLDLFWQGNAGTDSPLLLRLILAVAVLTLVISLVRLLGPRRRALAAASPEDLALVREILSRYGKAWDFLALLGDKSFYFNEEKDACIVYTISAKTWLCLGDPLGPPEKLEALLWSFMASCHKEGGRPVFYEVDKHHLDLYLAAGLKAVKIGEEGYINLAQFSLDNKERRRLRYYKNHLDKSGCQFSVLPKEEVRPLLEELKLVSDAWLKGKNVREKKFSLGFFDPDYLCKFPLALVRQEGKIVAFANLLCTDNRTDMTADLMRFIPGKVDHVMDYLFTNLLLYAKSAGYQRCSLGMAPLSGVRRTMQGALWNRLANLLFDHGEYLYNFRGLRAFKDQYLPVWTPRFLIYPGGLGTPSTLLDISAAISGGIQGIVKK